MKILLKKVKEKNFLWIFNAKTCRKIIFVLDKSNNFGLHSIFSRILTLFISLINRTKLFPIIMSAPIATSISEKKKNFLKALLFLS
jgi:hypothetical protein